MGYCYLCEKDYTEKFFSYFCSDCREIKNIMNVYGKEKVKSIIKSCCIRNQQQIENKIEIELHKDNITDKVYNLRHIKSQAKK